MSSPRGNRQAPRIGRHRSNPSQYIPSSGPANANVYNAAPRTHVDWAPIQQSTGDTSWISSSNTQFNVAPAQFHTSAPASTEQTISPPSPEVTAPIGFVLSHTPQHDHSVPRAPLDLCTWNGVEYQDVWAQRQMLGQASDVEQGEEWVHAQYIPGMAQPQQHGDRITMSSAPPEYPGIYSPMSTVGLDGDWVGSPPTSSGWAPH